MSARRYRLQRVVDTHPDIRWLDAEIFPDDQGYMPTGATWWLVRHQGDPVGFAGLKYWPADQCGYLCRAGVHPAHRGQGLQRRLIRARVIHAKAQGWRGVYTYTLPHNYTSANNLISCGFRMFWPSYAWGGEDACYWWLPLFESASRGGGPP